MLVVEPSDDQEPIVFENIVFDLAYIDFVSFVPIYNYDSSDIFTISVDRC